jgi:hypothetical protein
MNRKSSAHTTTTSVVRPLSSNKIDKDILKHASRIRKMTPSKDSLSKSPRRDTVSNATSPSKQNSTTKPVKSLSLVSCYSISRIFMYFLSFPDESDEYQWRESSN